MKFLILRFSSIGDIVLTTPLIRCLKQQYKDAELHYLVKNQFLDVLKHNPYIDKLWLWNKDENNQLISQLKNEKFDFIIDLHKNLRTFRLKQKLKIKSFSFNKINLEKWLLVNTKINRLPDVHIVDRYLHTLKNFQVVNDNAGLDYFLGKDDEELPEDVKKKLPSKFICLVIGAQHSTKKMPEDLLAQICSGIHHPVIILGGPGDKTSAHEILTLTENKNVFDFSGKLSLNQSAYLVKISELVISHDTGLMHIASAFKKKIISIWGNTVPELGMYPYLPHPQSRIFEVNNLSCRPCSKIGFDKCPKKHFKCMKEQDVHGIANFANSLMDDIS
ncbi:MAG: glycosyltransferase family 9 protein [Bacteroidales bacterium]|nr:glycosyltransferase family 9 protein [Bacteroidales bacterium]MCF8391463.1 glycosyltransferase family 9 protein [Bacteroidales bacterium]